jgi:hypothetical protein
VKYYVKYKISENIAETPEGYLVCIGVPIARTGEMIYGDGETPLEADDKGQVLITRDEQEVFRPETIASFEGKAITIKHPEEFVGPDNWSELAKGVIQNVRRGKGEQGDDLIADLLITDKMAIGLVRNGLREVSCGYEADYEQIEDGKGKQKNIIGNHLALVNQGRAGSGYAINDHKGELKMSLKDKIKGIFAKAQDEAMKIAEDEDKKEDKAKDEDKKDEKKDDSKDASAYDELVKMVKDLSEKISGMAPKDEKKDDAKDDDKEEKKDDAKDEPSSLEDRLKALETCVEKLMDKKAGDEDMESEDEDEESEDDDFENSSMVGDEDTLSRAEILAPGIKKSKDIKVKALKAAFETEEGKKAIELITKGKAVAYDSAEKVDIIFNAASEVLKASRTADLSKTKKTKDYSSSLENEGPITAEKMNEINAKFYKKA